METAARHGLWISGESVPSDAGTWFPVENPYTGAVVAEVARAGRTDAVRAVEAAASALADWSGRPGNERANILHRLYRLVREHREELTRLLVEEIGKVKAEAAKEVRAAGGFIRFAAEEARRIGGDIVPAPDRRQRIMVLQRPVGVVGAITPANGPANVFGRKAASALSAGCTVVVKPAEETPLCTLALAKLATEAGVPPGALNVLVGDAPAIAEVFVSHPAVRIVSFTGSVNRGAQLAAQAGQHMKRVVLELGGVAAFLVFEDADIEAALDGFVAAKFRMSGQLCGSPQRILVQESALSAFRDGLLARCAALRFGDPYDSRNHYGPLYHERILKGLDALVIDAVSKGAKVLCGGGRGEGLLYPPTVLTDVSPEMDVRRQEAFGPLVTLEQFEDDAEAIELANDTEYGLAAYVYTRDGARGWSVAEAIESGVVGVNDPFPVTVEGPFGGVKKSGLGREGGRYGIDEFLVTKQITFRV
jgi:succinate-semialdehyde dehydrogenase/glutarate-semialdehyde dehydrogenase